MEFKYEAVNADGQTVTGFISADTDREALTLLKQQTLTPTSLALDQARVETRRVFWQRKVSAQDKALVVKELGTLLQAGVSLAEAVDSMAQSHGEDALGQAFSRVHATLRSGGSFSSALKDSAIDWPDYLHQLAAAGEQTGKLAAALHNAADQMEYEERVRDEIRNALIYPAILVLSGISAVLLVFLVVVPKFASLLKSSKAKIPDISVWVLKTGLFVKENLLFFGLAAAGVVMLAVALSRSAAVRAQAMEWISRVPILGRWLNDTEMGRWSSMLATLLENRVPILAAMELAEASLRLNSLRYRLQPVLREIRAGKKIADAMETTRLLQVSGLNLIRVGERSGELPKMLRTLAQLYENAGRQRLKRFLVLLEPAAILLIGGVIGFVMVAIMLAITSLSNVSL